MCGIFFTCAQLWRNDVEVLWHMPWIPCEFFACCKCSFDIFWLNVSCFSCEFSILLLFEVCQVEKEWDGCQASRSWSCTLASKEQKSAPLRPGGYQPPVQTCRGCFCCTRTKAELRARLSVLQRQATSQRKERFTVYHVLPFWWAFTCRLPQRFVKQSNIVPSKKQFVDGTEREREEGETVEVRLWTYLCLFYSAWLLPVVCCAALLWLYWGNHVI